MPALQTKSNSLASFVELRFPWLMPCSALLLGLAVVVELRAAFAWPLVHDAPLIHYVIFLMAHGFAPYRDIIEINPPGTYMMQWFAIHLFGPGAFGWWLWDASSGIAAISASAWIAGKSRRAAGIAGGAIAYMFHLESGANNFGQRDWIVAVLLLIAIGSLFASIRQLRPAWMAASMAAFGLSASIKPPALVIGVFFLCAACWILRSRQQPAQPNLTPYILWALLGGILPVIACALFLRAWGVPREFLETFSRIVPYYASVHRLSIFRLLRPPIHLAPFLGSGIVLFLLAKSWRHWESVLLAAGALAGFALFVTQGKGWNYHLYPEVAPLTLWALLEMDQALKASLPQRRFATASLFVLLFLWAPFSLRAELTSSFPESTLIHLENDLTDLGGSQLSGKVQCLDMTHASCINVLYRMQLVQSTGFIYDFYLFPKNPVPVTTDLQRRFLQAVTTNPPRIFILSSQNWTGGPDGYEQLKNWPAFNHFLQQNYSVVREFPEPKDSAGYRIYQRNHP